MAIRLAKMVRLAEQLRANGTHTYLATVKSSMVLKMANLNLSNLVATKDLISELEWTSVSDSDAVRFRPIF